MVCLSSTKAVILMFVSFHSRMCIGRMHAHCRMAPDIDTYISWNWLWHAFWFVYHCTILWLFHILSLHFLYYQFDMNFNSTSFILSTTSNDNHILNVETLKEVVKVRNLKVISLCFDRNIYVITIWLSYLY